MDRVGHIVRRRAVFFVPGFDPAPPRALRERYRREATKQARLSGHVIQISAGGSHAWRLDAVIEGQAGTVFAVFSGAAHQHRRGLCNGRGGCALGYAGPRLSVRLDRRAPLRALWPISPCALPIGFG